MEQIPEPKLNENTYEVSVDPSLNAEAPNIADKTLIVNDSGALPVIALIVSILGLVCCSSLILPIVGLVMGKISLNQIRRGTLNPRHESIAKIAYILGIVGTAISILFWIVYIGYMFFIFTSGSGKW